MQQKCRICGAWLPTNEEISTCPACGNGLAYESMTNLPPHVITETGKIIMQPAEIIVREFSDRLVIRWRWYDRLVSDLVIFSLLYVLPYFVLLRLCWLDYLEQNTLLYKISIWL